MDTTNRTDLGVGTLDESISGQFDRMLAGYTESNPAIVLWFEGVIAHFVETMHGAWDGDFDAAVYTLMKTIKVLDEMAVLHYLSCDGYFLLQGQLAASGRKPAATPEKICERYPDLAQAILFFDIVAAGTVDRQEVRDYLCTALSKLLQLVGPTVGARRGN